MAKPMYAQYDHKKVPILGLVAESGAAPASPVNGQFYYDTTANRMYIRENGAWVLATQTGAILSGGAAGGDLTGTYPNPTIAALAVTDAKVAAANKDGAAGTPSMRTLGTGATQAAAGNHGHALTDANITGILPIAQIPTGTTGSTVALGNDARFTDSRTPNGSAGGDLTGTYPNPTVANLAITAAKIANATITDTQVAAANKDGVAGTASLRTLGTGAQQALAGNTRLDQITAPTTSVSLNSQKITNLANGTAATDAVNLSQLDAARQGYAGTKDPVRVATTTNVNLASPGASLDGVAMVAGDRFLAQAQTTTTQNGIYVWNGAAVAATRATDADAAGEVKDGTTVAVGEGTDAGSIYIQNVANAGAPGTWTQLWVKFNTGGTTYSGGAGLVLTGTTFDVVGTANRITANADSIDIASTYVGQTSITTLGTITAGTWNGTDIAVADGGTGASTAAAARTNLGAVGKYVTTPGTAWVAGTAKTINHALNTTDVVPSFYDATLAAGTDLEWSITDANNITVTSQVALSASQIKVVVVG